MDIQGLQQQLRDFAAARDWQPFHSPKNLAMALMVEAAELLELFQWLTTEQSYTLTRDEVDKTKVADEIADVFLYLLQIADKTNIDLEHAVQQKLCKNAEKYPSKLQQAQAVQPRVHMLVDWENVQPDAEVLQTLVPAGTDVWLFHSPGFVLKPAKLDAYHALYGADRVTLVERTGHGKNALDFQLSYYAGYLMARQPDAQFVVVSNDKGYEPMLAHARPLEFQAQLTTYTKVAMVDPLAAPAPAPALSPKVVLRNAGTKHRVAQHAEQTLAQFTSTTHPQVRLNPPSAAQIAFRAREALVALPLDQRPIDLPTLELWTAGLIHESAAGLKPAIARMACRLLQIRGTIAWDAQRGRLQYQCPSHDADLVVVPSSQPAVFSSVQHQAQSLKAQLPTKAVKAAKAFSVASRGQVPVLAPKSAPQPTKAAVKKSVSQVAQKVGTALRRSTQNRPASTKALLQMIQAHIPANAAHMVTPQQVCAVLQAQQVVKITKNASLSYPHGGRPLAHQTAPSKTVISKKEPVRQQQIQPVNLQLTVAGGSLRQKSTSPR